ncbi:MAG: Stp1/IreP family PP2C-type Ser/Thr phosphatase [Oscillospiraceae bacterium]|nr:Stp1/IreP family PP2C-type Ser/Thr phosphatase [Oscillospiraceae bacterium]
MKEVINLKITAKTDVGKLREINEDSYYVYEDEQEYKLCMLADGMGGYDGGEVASNLSILTAKKYIENNIAKVLNDENIIEVLKGAILEAHNEILIKAERINDLEEMGTTLDICLINNNKLYIAHVGDGRVYMIRDGEIKQITVDHSFVEDLIREGTITREEAENHPKKHMLMKALGGEMNITPDTYIEELKEHDKILMCTDGLSNMLKKDEIFEIIQNNKESAHNELVNMANKKGGRDNITVIVIEN